MSDQKRSGIILPGDDGPYRKSAVVLSEHDACKHPNATAVFDEEAAKGLDVPEIRKRWPRVPCPDCGTIMYASYMHYLQGDW